VVPGTGRIILSVAPVGHGRFMAKQSQRKFAKRQKEFERMRKAKEKMDRRQGKIDDNKGAEGGETAEKVETGETPDGP
jgi:hypothetical protein